jgi:hypothetical protein
MLKCMNFPEGFRNLAMITVSHFMVVLKDVIVTQYTDHWIKCACLKRIGSRIYLPLKRVNNKHLLSPLTPAHSPVPPDRAWSRACPSWKGGYY